MADEKKCDFAEESVKRMQSNKIYDEKNYDHAATIPIFVYGTLMRGQRAAHMLEQYEYVGEFVLKDYALYNVSYYPGIKYLQGASTIGEVYLVDEACISRMDEYEVEGSLYIRKMVNVENAECAIEAYVYVYNKDVDGLVIEGKWTCA